LLNAHNKNIPIQMLNTATECPLSQREEDNVVYRSKQLMQHYKAMEYLLKKEINKKFGKRYFLI
jgi:hypothetical protein